ncbi:MAG: hypothetical protein DRO15_07760 [Thermoprotei archaeon]|nr:MAG: hypothetical protein DRO15_07760 [Thermoprotei archaeon]
MKLKKPTEISVKDIGKGYYEIFYNSKKYYIALLRVLRALNREKQDDLEIIEGLRRAVESLVRRSKRGFTYSIVTTISKNGALTYIAILGKDKSVIDREIEVVTSLIDSMSNGNITLKHSKSGIIRPKILVIPLKSRYKVPVPELHKIQPEVVRVPEPLIKPIHNGEIYLGTTLSTSYNYPISLKAEHLFRHIGIFGSTGSGKTTTASIIAYRASLKGMKVLILDWHGEYTNILKKGKDKLSIFTLDATKPMSINELNINELISKPTELLEVFEQVLDLSPAQLFILDQVLERGSRSLRISPCWLKSLVELVAVYNAESRWSIEARDALYRKLKYLAANIHCSSSSNIKTTSINDHDITVIDLSKVVNTRLRTLYALLILKMLELSAVEHGILTDLLVVIDEAHHVLPSRTSEVTGIARKLLAEMRKWHIGFIIVSQSPSSTSSDVLKNTNTKIIHAIKSNIDKRIVVDSIIIRKELEDTIPYLKVGEAIIVTPEATEPIIVRIDPRPLINIEIEGSLSGYEIELE